MIFGQGPRNIYILCGPVSVPLQKIPEEERCIVITEDQAVIQKGK